MQAVQLWEPHPKRRLHYIPTPHTIKAVRVFLLCERERVLKDITTWQAQLDADTTGDPDVRRYVAGMLAKYRQHLDLLETLIPNVHLRAFPDSSVLRAEDECSRHSRTTREAKARKVGE